MISYREKELIVVQKFLSDRTKMLSDRMNDIESVKSGCEMSILPDIDNYDELVQLAKDSGYEVNYRVEDILSKQELEQLENEYDEVNDEFKRLTRLNKVDCAFVVTATALQVLRQLLQPKVDFEGLDSDKRPNDKEAAKEAKDSYDKEKAEKAKAKADNDETTGSRYYYAKLEDIASISKGVPYDVIDGTKQFNLQMNGNNHRYRTLGHDPVLGYLFGTCNILTNTMSLGKDNLFRTIHIKDSKAVANADMVKMFGYSYKRYKESKSTVVLALLKQMYHIASDTKSKRSLELPFLQLLTDTETIEKLCDAGFDYNNLLFVKTIGIQAGLAEMINFIISVTHRIAMAIEENKEKGNAQTTIEAVKNYNVFKKENKLPEVRTRKVILISDSIATGINATAVGISCIYGVANENEIIVNEALNHLDVGGIIDTVIHLFSDIRFITKVKKEFIAKAIDEDFQNKLRELEE